MSPVSQTQFRTVDGNNAVSPVISAQSRALKPFAAVPPKAVSDDPRSTSLSLPPDKPSISWN